MTTRKKWTAVIAVSLALQAGLAAFPASEANAAADNTNNYRVYQNDNALREFRTSADAIRYAAAFTYSHVEKITGREWVWDNLPKYKVYQNGISSVSRDFRTLAEAKKYAQQQPFAQIRDLEATGFESATYPVYRLYQGDRTLAAWSFATLAAAKSTAKRYGNAHIMNVSTNQWVWDNISDAQENAQRQAAPIYSVLKDGVPLSGQSYGFLLDAIRASGGQSGSVVVNTATNQTVHTNSPSYTVIQSGPVVGSFYDVGNAIAYAKTLSGATVLNNGSPYWTNAPYLAVYQRDTLIRSFFTRKSAVQFAAAYKDSVVMTMDHRALWNNAKKLLYLGWNGSSNTQTVLGQLGQTQGLDIDSPSWFELSAADGSFGDDSDPALVNALRESGIRLEPLVSNGFDTKLTSAFLRNPAGQSAFISRLVAKLKLLNVSGVNVDFENMSGGDRALYTAFVRSLTSAAHKAGLKVSVDLPRGDVSWDAKTAYDQAALAAIVDMIMIMTYDQYWKGSDEAGSVAELPWVEEGVRQFLAYGVPREKLMLGIPFYVREWRVDATGKLVDNKAIIMSSLPSLIQQTGAKGVYDAGAGQTKYTYRGTDGYTHVFWAETSATVAARLAIAEKYDLAGVAAWRLGYEQADLWNLLLTRK